MKSSLGSISQRNLDVHNHNNEHVVTLREYQCTLCGANQKLPQSCPAWIHSFCELDKRTTSREYQEQVPAHFYPQFVLTLCYQSSLLLGSIFPR